MSLPGAVQVVADPPSAYARLVAEQLDQRDEAHPFRLAVSGGASGEACMRALLAEGLPWGGIELLFVDERCVPLTDERSNAGSLAGVLGARREGLAGWHPMSCEEGPGAYERLVREGGLDLVQLGFGPDGHVASLFPGSAGLEAPPGALVALNEDPSGHNPLPRMTLTLAAIASSPTVVVVVSGAEKHDALAGLLAGEDLPAGRVRAAERLVWLIDEAATEGLREQLSPS